MKKLIALMLVATSPAFASDRVVIESVPHVRQKPDFCGEACAEMALRKLGVAIDQDEVFDRSGVDPALGRGCTTPELARTLKDLGFEVGDVWFKVGAASERDLEARLRELRADLDRGVPSIVCMRWDESEGASEHFRLVVGFEKDEVVYHDPAVDGGAYLRMKRERFLSLWPLKYSTKEWTIVRMRLEPKKLAAPRAAAAKSPAFWAQHVLALRKKLPGDGFTVVVEPPFVVVGDEPESRVRARSRDTVRWAVDRLKAAYFDEDPRDPIDVWLFKDKESYETNAKRVFGETPTTPFGWYSPSHRALIMNISTGGGTLVHEIVHPFVHANFPECPPWLNEGLGSLYEQCGDSSGRIRGYTNWRLAGLKDAIRAKRLPTFKELAALDHADFYDRDRGANYAQSRYLLYWLQENGKLRDFWRAAVKNRKDDPTCYAALVAAIGEDDMTDFQKRWEQWVLTLKFPE